MEYVPPVQPVPPVNPVEPVGPPAHQAATGAYVVANYNLSPLFLAATARSSTKQSATENSSLKEAVVGVSFRQDFQNWREGAANQQKQREKGLMAQAEALFKQKSSPKVDQELIWLAKWLVENESQEPEAELIIWLKKQFQAFDQSRWKEFYAALERMGLCAVARPSDNLNTPACGSITFDERLIWLNIGDRAVVAKLLTFFLKEMSIAGFEGFVAADSKHTFNYIMDHGHKLLLLQRLNLFTQTPREAAPRLRAWLVYFLNWFQVHKLPQNKVLWETDVIVALNMLIGKVAHRYELFPEFASISAGPFFLKIAAEVFFTACLYPVVAERAALLEQVESVVQQAYFV